MDWEQIENSGKYQSLTPEQRFKVKASWFNDNVASSKRYASLSNEDRMKVFSGFMGENFEPENEEGTSIGDYGRSLGIGLDKFGQLLGRGVSLVPGLGQVGKDIENFYKEREAKLTAEQSTAYKKELEKRFLAEEGGLGDAWTSPAKIGDLILKSLPGTAAGMGSGMGIAKGLMHVTKMSKGMAGIIGMGLGEGVIAGSETAKEVYDIVANAPEEQLFRTKEFNEALKTIPEKDPNRIQKARNKVARNASLQSGLVIGGSTAALGAIPGYFMGKALGGEGGKNIATTALKQMAIEPVQEMPQSAHEAYESARVKQKFVDPSIDPTADVAESAVAGGVAGAVMGLGGGAMAHVARTPDTQKVLDDTKAQEEETKKVIKEVESRLKKGEMTSGQARDLVSDFSEEHVARKKIEKLAKKYEQKAEQVGIYKKTPPKGLGEKKPEVPVPPSELKGVKYRDLNTKQLAKKYGLPPKKVHNAVDRALQLRVENQQKMKDALYTSNENIRDALATVHSKAKAKELKAIIDQIKKDAKDVRDLTPEQKEQIKKEQTGGQVSSVKPWLLPNPKVKQLANEIWNRINKEAPIESTVIQTPDKKGIMGVNKVRAEKGLPLYDVDTGKLITEPKKRRQVARWIKQAKEKLAEYEKTKSKSVLESYNEIRAKAGLPPYETVKVSEAKKEPLPKKVDEIKTKQKDTEWQKKKPAKDVPIKETEVKKPSVPVTKASVNVGRAWIEGLGFKPIAEARLIKRGKNKGKYWVRLTRGRNPDGSIKLGRKKLVSEDAIKSFPSKPVNLDSEGKPLDVGGAPTVKTDRRKLRNNIVANVKNQKGEAVILSDLVNYGRTIYDKGATKFKNFRANLKQDLKKVWDKIKHLAKKAFRQVQDIVKNERGSINIDIKKKSIATPSETKKTPLRASESDLKAIFKNISKKDKSLKKAAFKLAQGPNITKEGRDILVWAKQRFGKGFVDEDMKWYHAAFGNPYFLGKKFSSIKRAVQIEIDHAEERQKEVLYYYDKLELERVQNMMDKDKNAANELQGLIWKWDQSEDPIPVKEKWYKKDGDNYVLNEKHYPAVQAYLKSQGVTDSVADAFVTIRKALDYAFLDVQESLKSDLADPTLIQEFRQNIGKIHNYFPHKRNGNAFVALIDDKTGATLYREHYYNFYDKFKPKRARQRAIDWANEKGITDYSIKQNWVKQLPDEVFFQIPVESMQQIANQAAKEVEKKRIDYEAKRIAKKDGIDYEVARKQVEKSFRMDMEKHISKAMADIFKVRGWGKHAVNRENIPGFKQDDIFTTLFEYISGYAGFKTKIARARAHHKNMIGIDAMEKRNEYQYLAKYVQDMLANQDKTDKVVDTIRGLFFVKYLGFVIKSGFVNLSQNAVMAAPVLSVHTKGAHRKLAKAMKDVRRALTSKEAWTSKEVTYGKLDDIEQEAIHALHEHGNTMDIQLRELQGSLPKYGSLRLGQKLLRRSGIFMMLAERFNRTSTGLAAFRIAYNEGAKVDGVDTKGNYDLSVEFAKRRIYDSHFLYGKANLPSTMRGGRLAKFTRSAYTFRSFSHNYILSILHMLRNQPGGKRAVMRSVRNLFLLGGLTSVPFFKAFSSALMKGMGKEDEDALTKIRETLPSKYLRDMTTYGFLGMGGVDISGSLSIEFPRNWGDILGVPYSAWTDSVNMYESWKSGQRLRASMESPLTPMQLRNIHRGLQLYTTGQRTRSGRDINIPGEIGPKKIDLGEMLKKTVLGFQPTSVSKGYMGYQAIQKSQQMLSKKKSRLASRFVNAYRKQDTVAMQNIMNRIIEWNERMKKEGKPWMFIDIRRSVQNRLKPGIKRIPKQLRGKSIEIGQVWK